MTVQQNGGRRRKAGVVRSALPADTREFPLVEIKDGPGLFGVQFFPRGERRAMAVGFIPKVYAEWMRESFQEVVTRDAAVYAATESEAPEFVPGAVYVESYFGTPFGPLEANADDPEAVVAEAAAMFGYENIDDQRTTK